MSSRKKSRTSLADSDEEVESQRTPAPKKKGRRQADDDDEAEVEQSRSSQKPSSSQKKRGRKSKGQSDEEEEAEEATQATQKGGPPVTAEERDMLISNMTRFILFKHSQKLPVTRGEISKESLKDYAKRRNLFDELMVVVKERIRVSFGLQVVEIHKTATRAAATAAAAAAATQASQAASSSQAAPKAPKAASSAGAYFILVLAKEGDADEMQQRAASLSNNAEAAEFGFLNYIILMITTSGYRIAEDDLNASLQRMGIRSRKEVNPQFGCSVDEVLERFVKQQYLEKFKEAQASADAPLAFYRLGDRTDKEQSGDVSLQNLSQLLGHEVQRSELQDSVDKDYDVDGSNHAASSQA